PFCDVLPESVARAVAQFQRRGGIVVADEYLTPAIVPDIVVPVYRRTKKAQEDKQALQALAAQLRKELDVFYTRYGEASNPDVVVRFRQYGTSDYLFALNDRRTFGNYVGHHGLVMEKGLPHQATLTVRRPSGFVYDLVEHRAVPTKSEDGALRFDARFGPGGGRLFLITANKISGVKAAAPPSAKRGQAVSLAAAVVDAAGKPLDAVIPLELRVLDPQGRPADVSGYYGAAGGRLSVTLNLAPNDLPGTWTLQARELASGLERKTTFRVLP
ncbi:MAG: hypothetical protein QHJ73_11760, partial [Armatimonadota bacterium]|nr:hypothetical protein [Armatimonadota bacterium]